MHAPGLDDVIVPPAFDPFAAVPAVCTEREALERVAAKHLAAGGVAPDQAQALLADLLAAASVLPDPDDPAGIEAWLRVDVLPSEPE